MQKLNGQSLDIVSENVTKLKEIFPEVFSEGKVDYTKLEEALGEFRETQNERYNFTWNGKQNAKKIAQTPSAGTLRPCKEESKDWDSTKNLYIEGDNLEVLKLLQKSYHKKVKMIYIDPPYNTGKDFVYKDNFKDNIKNYLEQTGQVDSEGNRLSTNSETNGRYHSDWLSMMYPRLKLARNLLKDDGVIFISIDDNEVANLRKLCDEIFGEDNFVASSVWQKKYGPANDAKYISQTHESILVYAKNLQFWIPGILPRTEEQLKAFSNPDNDERGLWRASDLSVRTHSSLGDYTIVGPNGEKYNPPASRAWAVNQNKFFELQSDNRITFGKDGTSRPMFKKFLTEVKQGITPETWWNRDKAGDNKIARYEIKDIFPENIFDTPKPTKLIQLILQIANINDSDIILDFFSGSATTSHSVMKQNSEDNGNRKYVMVQLPEKSNEKSAAYKAGYKNICEIGKERIRRAGKKIIADNPDKDLSNLDIGFKVFKLDSSNIKGWDSAFDNLETNLLDAVDNIKSDRSSEDLLYEILLKYGLDLTLPIEEKTINNKKVFIIGFGALVVCLDDDITTDTVEAIAKLKEEYKSEVMRVVFKDSSFKDAVVKTNAIQILKQFGIDEVVSV
jgi:adenine-specific DNA-methyltransferase